MAAQPEYICQTCGGSFSLPLGRYCAEHQPVPRYECPRCGHYTRADPRQLLCSDCVAEVWTP